MKTLEKKEYGRLNVVSAKDFVGVNTFDTEKQMNGNMVLEGIFHSGNVKQSAIVIINGQTLKINEYIGEYRLEIVNDTSVVLRSLEQQLELSIFSSVVIK